MHKLLADIVATKQREIQTLSPFPVLRKSRKRDFVGAISNKGIIAEIKPKSPSAKRIISRSQVSKFVRIYNKHAQAISVLCDEEFFGGGYPLLSEVRKQTDLPILAKEFILDKKQIAKAKCSGADAVLLIVAILDEKTLLQLAKYALSLGLDVLIEVSSKLQCKQLVQICKNFSDEDFDHIAIGVNNRNLGTLHISIDLQKTKELIPYLKKGIPKAKCFIAESGIKSSKDTQLLSKYVNGFLVGTSILKAKDPEKYLQSLRPIMIKFCGFTNKNDICNAEKMGVDYIGLIFVKESPRYLSLSKAEKLRKCIKHAKTVGVFGDMPVKEIKKYVEKLNLDYVQFHGSPDLKKVKKFSKKAIQVFQGYPGSQELQKYSDYSKFLLIDKEPGKKSADFLQMKKLPAELRSKVFIAGGLSPKNVHQKVNTIRPYAVDCASGIELKNKPGKKSSEAMRTFIQNLSR